MAWIGSTFLIVLPGMIWTYAGTAETLLLRPEKYVFCRACTALGVMEEKDYPSVIIDYIAAGKPISWIEYFGTDLLNLACLNSVASAIPYAMDLCGGDGSNFQPDHVVLSAAYLGAASLFKLVHMLF